MLNKRILAAILAVVIAGSISGIFVIRSAVAPTGDRVDRHGKYRFLVEIDGITQAAFSEVEGLNVTVGVWEYRDGSGPTAPMLEPGLARYGPLVLRWGLTESSELWDWMEGTITGDVQRRNIAVVILDKKGSELTRYCLSEAWPSGWSLGKLDSLGKTAVIEELVIQYEGLDRD